MSIIRIKMARPYGFSVLYGLFALGMGMNFFLTPNPYAAAHSGGAAQWAEVHSSTWTLHTGILMAVSIGTAFLVNMKRISFTWIFVFFSVGIWILLSGLFTSAIWHFPFTYGYNLFALLFVALVAFNDIKASRPFNGGKFFYAVLVVYLAGIALALIRPGIWGWIPFEFGRGTRGEVTLASITALPLIITSGLVAFKQVRNISVFLIVATLAVIEFSFYTRTTMWMIAAPVFIGIIFWILKSWFLSPKVGKIAPPLLVFLYFMSFFICCFLVVISLSPDRLEVFLNARWPLWEFHWQLFLSSPLFGVGAFPLQRFSYTGNANSEVGLLSAFSQFGFIFGFFQIVVVVAAMKKAMSILLNRVNNNELATFFSIIIITYIPIWLLGGSWRILNAKDFLFWFGVFFLFFYKYHSSPLKISRIQNASK